MKRPFLFFLLSLHAVAFAAGDVQITGSHTNSETTMTFTCLGTPTCTGSYTAVERLPECSSPITHGGVFSVTGVSLSGPGTFGGMIFLEGGDLNAHSVNGVCNPTFNPLNAPYTATWDGRNGMITVTAPDGTFSTSFTASVS